MKLKVQMYDKTLPYAFTLMIKLHDAGSHFERQQNNGVSIANKQSQSV